MVDTLLNVFEKIIYSEKVEVVTRGWWICTGLLWQTDGRNDPCIKHPEKTNNLHNCSYKVSCVRNFAAIIIQLSLWHTITNWADIEKILNGIQNQEIYYQISNFRWKGRTDGKWCILWLILCCLLVLFGFKDFVETWWKTIQTLKLFWEHDSLHVSSFITTFG